MRNKERRMKKYPLFAAILLLLCAALLLSPVAAEPPAAEQLRDGCYTEGSGNTLLLLRAPDGTRIAQFTLTDGLGGCSFSAVGIFDGSQTAVELNGRTCRITFSESEYVTEERYAVYVYQEDYLYADVSGNYFFAPDEKPEITAECAMLLLEHTPEAVSPGASCSWTAAPALLDNAFRVLTCEAGRFWVLRDGSSAYRVRDNASPELLFGSLQQVLDYLNPDPAEQTLSRGLQAAAPRLQCTLPASLLSHLTLRYSSGAKNIVRVNSAGRLLPRASGSARVTLYASLNGDEAALSIPVSCAP